MNTEMEKIKDDFKDDIHDLNQYDNNIIILFKMVESLKKNIKEIKNDIDIIKNSIFNIYMIEKSILEQKKI